MPLSIRLDNELENELRLRLQREGIALSEFVRDAIKEKLAKNPQANSPYELGKNLFGRYSSGETQRSANRKVMLREKVHAMHRR